MLGMLVCVALGIADPDEMEWTASKAKIPIDYIPARIGEIRQLLVYVSLDRGGTWTQHSTAQAGQSQFEFTAKKSRTPLVRAGHRESQRGPKPQRCDESGTGSQDVFPVTREEALTLDLVMIGMHIV